MLEWFRYILFGFVSSFFTWFFTKWLPDHPEYGEKIFYYILNLIPFLFSWKQRKIIEKEINGFITEEIKGINKDAYGFKILPKGIKVEWTLREQAEVLIGENEIIIRLGSRIDHCENFVDALMLYLSEACFSIERMYLDPILYEACKFQVAISMIKKRSTTHYKCFIEKYYKVAVEKYGDMLTYSEKLEKIEKCGLLVSAFLPTLAFYADKWISQRKAPAQEIQNEIINFLDFVYNIATSKEYQEEVGEKPPIDFEGKYIRISLIPVARKELANRDEYRPHFRKAKERLKMGADIVYIMGRGKNVSLAKLAAQRLKKDTLSEQINGASKFSFYTGENKWVEGICYAFQRKI